jgi:hypothetical protein
MEPDSLSYENGDRITKKRPASSPSRSSSIAIGYVPSTSGSSVAPMYRCRYSIAGCPSTSSSRLPDTFVARALAPSGIQPLLVTMIGLMSPPSIRIGIESE